MIWTLETSGRFSVRSLYLKLCQGTPSKYFSDLWRIGVTMKVQIFLCQVARKRLPSNENIRRRRGSAMGACALCWETEDNNHIFFSCPLAKFMWSAVRELLGHTWDPSCFVDIFRLLQNQVGQMRRVFWIASAALL
jgi:hypothetical protein